MIGPAMMKVLEEAGSITKRGQNTFHNYEYATAADVLHRLQGLFAKHKINVVKTEVDWALIDDNSALKVTYRFMLVHENGEVFSEFLDGTPLIFTGLSSCRNSRGGFDDKCNNKCSTAATKYFLIDFFKIATGDYDDADEHEDNPSRKPAPTPVLPKPAQQIQFDDPPPVYRAPEMIAFEGRKQVEWAVEFVAAIRGAQSASEVDEWCKLNRETMQKVTGAPLLTKIEDTLTAAYAAFESQGTVH